MISWSVSPSAILLSQARRRRVRFIAPSVENLSALAEPREGTVKHDDALQATIGALLHNVKAYSDGVAVGIDSVPRVAGDSLELVEATRPHDSTAWNISMELGHESSEVVVSDEPAIFVDQLDIGR
jgi:hypothetical protein